MGDGGFGTDLFDALRFPVLRAPSFSDSRCFDTAIDMVAAHACELAAVIIEPLVQGAAGMQLADPDGLEALGNACREHDVLLICDEVATGFGRTGTLFASEQCGLRPDLLVLGKGITGGYLPMSATAASRRVFDAFLGRDLGERTLYHGHSYSGNALAAAVALRHLELLQAWDVLENVRARSDELRGLLDDRIASHPGGCGSAPVRAHGWRGARAARSETCAGDGACARRRSSVACCFDRSVMWSCSCRRSPSRRRSCTASCTRWPTRSTREPHDHELAGLGRPRSKARA